MFSVSSAELKVSAFIHKVENPATLSLTFVGQKGNLSYSREVMWKLTWLMLQQAHIFSRLLNYGNSLH